MNLFRVNLKQLLMLAVFAGIATSFWVMLPKHEERVYSLYQFSPNENRLLVMETSWKKSSTKPTGDQLLNKWIVIDLETGRRHEMEYADAKRISDRERKVDEWQVVRFGDNDHVYFLYDRSDNVRFGDRNYSMEYVWNPLSKNLAHGKQLTSKNDDIRKWSADYESWASVWRLTLHGGMMPPVDMRLYRCRPYPLINCELTNGDFLVARRLDGDRYQLEARSEFSAADEDSIRVYLRNLETKVEKSTVIPSGRNLFPICSHRFELFFVQSTFSRKGYLLDAELNLLGEHQIHHAQISHFGTHLVIQSNCDIQIFDSKGKHQHTYDEIEGTPLVDGFTPALISGKGKYLAVAKTNRLVVFDNRDGSVVLDENYQTNSVFSRWLAFFGLLVWPLAAALWVWPNATKKKQRLLIPSIQYVVLLLGLTLTPLLFALALSRNPPGLWTQTFISWRFPEPSFGVQNLVTSIVALVLFLVLRQVIRMIREKQTTQLEWAKTIGLCVLGASAIYWFHQSFAVLTPNRMEFLLNKWKWNPSILFFTAALLTSLLCLWGGRFWPSSEIPETKS